MTTLTICVTCYCISLIISQKLSYFKFRHINGIIALFLIFYIGGYITQSKYHNLPCSHYKSFQGHINGFSGTIVSPVIERKNHFRYDFKLAQIVTSDSIFMTSGLIHLYVKKDSSLRAYTYGDQLNVYGRFYEILPPANPKEFNYKRYLARQGIYSQAFIKRHDIELRRHKKLNTFMKWSFDLRRIANFAIDKNINHPRERGIAKALLLGIKDHLDNDLKKAYSAAGAMHVLAVSGLHVGIVFLLIKLIFGRLKESGKWGGFIFVSLSISSIWIYASVTGLSPSVLRAATMFSIISLGELSFRESNIYNSLGIAAFILLLYDPYLIYSVGFQLSFSAVLGIVYLQPKIYRLLEFKLMLLDKAWGITCVSIAAQIATFPLTAYYFNQFPTYFLLSNLFVIPASFLMLVGGLVMILIDPISSSVASMIGYCTEQLMWFVNEMISYVHHLPLSLIEWIYIDFVELIIIYVITLTLITGLQYGVFRTLVLSSALILAILSWNLFRHSVQSRKHELVIYEVADKIAIDHIQGHSSKLYLNTFNTEELELLSFQINPYRISSGLRPIEEGISTFEKIGFVKKSVISHGMIAHQRFTLIDSTTFHLEFNDEVNTDYLIVSNGAVKSLNWLNDQFDFKMVILSTKNSSYYTRKMKDQAKKLNLNLHSLKEDGALIIDVDR